MAWKERQFGQIVAPSTANVASGQLYSPSAGSTTVGILKTICIANNSTVTQKIQGYSTTGGSSFVLATRFIPNVAIPGETMEQLDGWYPAGFNAHSYNFCTTGSTTTFTITGWGAEVTT
ncbi:MAG: hypothetical protein ACYSR0_11075 [Planctomycetota bacterium]|jgi:hypothetical protein